MFRLLITYYTTYLWESGFLPGSVGGLPMNTIKTGYIPDLAWDKHKNVAGLNLLIWSQGSSS
jgi:hypothetical protein